MKKIAFVLPTTLGESGGVKIVFEYATRINDLNNVQCDVIYPLFPANIDGWKYRNIKTFIKYVGTILLNVFNYNYKRYNKSYSNVVIKKVKHLKNIDALHYDMIIATAWDTFKYVKNASSSKKKYFVQSYEIWNGPRETVIETYKDEDVEYLTITHFLEKLIGKRAKIIYNPIKVFKFGIKDYETLKYGVIYRNIEYKGFDCIVSFLKKYPQYRSQFYVVGRNIPLKYKKYFAFVYDGADRCGMEEFYEKINVLVVPSSNEGFGLPYIESMAKGIVVVSKKTGILYDIGDTSNFVEISIEDQYGAEGVTFSVVEAEEVYKSIKYIEGMSKEELRALSENATTSAKNYIESISIEENIDKIIN